tara:strand:+ start:439 stop:738 length:300 start_codon:yes stop_codon:yes gene_type:complete
MDNIRDQIQTWLELVTRAVKNIPFDKEVVWEDIEDVYNGDYYKPKTKAFNEELTFEDVYGDAVSIDHMSSEILEGDFERAMAILKRYRGIVLSETLESN